MSVGYVFSADATEDLKTIWQYVADEGSEVAADRVIVRIYTACQKLSEMPGMGHYREDLLDRRHRFWSVWSYLIVYRWEAAPIQIIAVVHGARNLAAFLHGRDDT